MPEQGDTIPILTVREFGSGDVAALAALLCEEERTSFARRPPDATTGEQRIRDLLPLGPEHVWLMAMAEDGDALGFAAAFRVFPGRELKPMWYLKSLYVRSDARDHGLGERLMRALAKAIIARGGERLEFSTTVGNDGAVRFYARLGVPVLPKVFYRIEDGELERLATGADTA